MNKQGSKKIRRDKYPYYIRLLQFEDLNTLQVRALLQHGVGAIKHYIELRSAPYFSPHEHAQSVMLRVKKPHFFDNYIYCVTNLKLDHPTAMTIASDKELLV